MGAVAKATAQAALSCGERRCQRQCVHVDAHFDEAFAITSKGWLHEDAQALSYQGQRCDARDRSVRLQQVYKITHFKRFSSLTAMNSRSNPKKHSGVAGHYAVIIPATVDTGPFIVGESKAQHEAP